MARHEPQARWNITPRRTTQPGIPTLPCPGQIIPSFKFLVVKRLGGTNTVFPTNGQRMSRRQHTIVREDFLLRGFHPYMNIRSPNQLHSSKLEHIFDLVEKAGLHRFAQNASSIERPHLRAMPLVLPNICTGRSKMVYVYAHLLTNDNWSPQQAVAQVEIYLQPIYRPQG